MGLLDGIASGFHDVVDGAVNTVVGVGEAAYNTIASVGDSVIRSAQGVVYSVQDFWEYFTNLIGEWFQSTFVRPFTAIVTALPNVIVNGVMAIARATASTAVNGINVVFK